jgi:uncharacterized protein (TIGR03435 family)
MQTLSRVRTAPHKDDRLTLMLATRLGLSLSLLTTIALAQTFEVSSIRLSGPKSIRGSEGGPDSKDPTRYTFGRADLEILIMIAYHVENFQVSSKLPLNRDEFDLAATIPTGATKAEFRIMLQNLLAERFQMKLHTESRDFPAFELVPAKGGIKVGTDAAARMPPSSDFPQLTPGKPGLIASNSINGGKMVTRIRAQQQPLSRLAEILRTAEPRPVVDRTGLKGNFDFVLQFASDLPNATADNAVPSDLPDLNTALREQLGLQLIARNLPFEVLVVESFNRFPSEN